MACRASPLMQSRSSLLPAAALLLTMVIWGSAAVFLRSTALALTPENSLALRYVALSVINIGGLLLLGTWRIPRSDWLRFLAAGTVGMAGYNWFVNQGFALVPAGVGTIITMIEPLMIAGLAWAMLGERLSRTLFAGLAVSLLGAVVLFAPDLASTSASQLSLTGIAALLVCCVCWALYTIIAKPLLARHDAFTVTAVTMLIAAPFLIVPASEPLHVLASRLDLRQWLEITYLVIPNGIVGTMLWNYGTKHLSGASTGAFLYLIPVVAVASGALVLGEAITLPIVAGGLLILAGVAIAEFGEKWQAQSGWLALLAVLFAVTAWGMVPVITRYLVLNLPIETVMVLRVAPAGIIGMVIALANGWKPLPWYAWRRAIIAAIGGNVVYQLLAIYGAQHIPASWMGMLFGLEPVFIALFSIMFAGERPTLWLYAGIAVSIFGTAVLMLGNAVAPAQDVKLIGLILVTLSTMGWGIYTVAIKPVAERYGSLQITGLTLALSAIPMLLFISPAFVGSLGQVTGFQWSVIAVIVLFCTILSTIAWNYAVSRMQGSLAGMFLYVQPIVAAISGALLLGEEITLTLLAGGFLILAGVALAQFGPRLVRPAAPAADLLES